MMSVDNVEDVVGRQFPGGEFTVERWMAYLWADATRNDDDAFRHEEAAKEVGADAQLVPPEFGMHIAMEGSGAGIEGALEGLDIDWESGVFHGEQSFTFHQPLVVGETYSVTGEVADVEQKEKFDILSLDYEATDTQGNPAFRTQTRIIITH